MAVKIFWLLQRGETESIGTDVSNPPIVQAPDERLIFGKLRILIGKGKEK
jgi:hypothetical protein